MQRGRGRTSGGNGGATRGRSGPRTSVGGASDDGDVVYVGGTAAPSAAAAPPQAAPVDAQLNDDLAEAHQLGIDADFIEQLRIMTPRTRATILSDFRGSQRREQPTGGRRGANPRPARADGPPRQRHRPSPGGNAGGSGSGAGRRHTGRNRHFDRHERYEDEFPSDWDPEDFYSDDDDAAVDDNTWEHEDTFPAPPPAGGGGRGRGAAGLPLEAQDPGMLLQMLLMQSMVGHGGRGRGGRGFALPAHMEQFLAQARANAEQARAMGADLDVDNMSYEELLALQERVGHVSKGLRADDIDRVSSVCPPPAEPSPTKGQDADADSCVICMTEFAATRDNDCRRVHVCGHLFHDACLRRWFKENKKCPICNRETS